MDIKLQLLEKIEQNRDKTILCVQEFIRYPSISKNEKSAQEYFASLLKELSMIVDMWEPGIEDTKINPHFLCDRNNFENSPNVVGILKGAGGGKSVILNGHVDVVPAGVNDWDDNPFSGVHKDGKIFGRGASDMKGGLISAVMAVKALRDLNIILKGDVIIQSVIEEESGGAGTLSAIKRGYKADAAIVPEPTDMRICPASIGAMWFRVTVKGLSAHAGTSYQGVNAIQKSMKVIEAINLLEDRRNSEKRHPLYKHVPVPFSINIGSIRGGVFPTNVPEEVVFEGRMGIAPGEEVTDARAELEDAIFNAAKQDDWMKTHMPVVEWYGFCFNSNEISQEHAIVKLLTKNYANITNDEPVIGGTPWGTDGASLSRFGQTPAVVFGPGPGERAHKANEYLDVEQLMTTTKVIAASLLDWCGY